MAGETAAAEGVGRPDQGWVGSRLEAAGLAESLRGYTPDGTLTAAAAAAAAEAAAAAAAMPEGEAECGLWSLEPLTDVFTEREGSADVCERRVRKIEEFFYRV